MNKRSAFATCNPIVNLVFFAGAVILAMFSTEPAFMIAGFVLAASYYIILKRSAGLKLTLGLIPVIAAVFAINYLFNRSGLMYGISLGFMFATVILWFASYSVVMTSDKFIYIFGEFAPSATLVLTMIFRLVPMFFTRSHKIRAARRALGKVPAGKYEEAAADISALTAWAFEGGIITADSMRSRGHGAGKRSHFAIYRFKTRDGIVMGVMAVLLGLFALGRISGNGLELAGYAGFLAIPVLIEIKEEITWLILKSKI